MASESGPGAVEASMPAYGFAFVSVVTRIEQYTLTRFVCRVGLCKGGCGGLSA